MTEGRDRATGHAVLVAAGILASRIAGLVRERVFAHFFGNSDAAGAFRAALRIPNLLQNLFGEGVLSASFIPVYARLLAEKQDELARRVAGTVAAFLALTVSVIVLAGVTLTPWIVDIVAPGFHGELRELTTRLVRILFPGIGLLVLSAWCLGILNSHRKFFLSYVAPVVWNFAMIVAMIVFGSLPSKDSLAIALAWGAVAGSALQFAVQLPSVLRIGGPFRLALDRTLEPVRTTFRNMGPVILGRGVVQISAYIDSMIASFLGALAFSSLGYAQTIYLLPLSLFGMSVAAAELPQMASATGDVESVHSVLRTRLSAGLRQIAFFVVPTTFAFLAIGDAFVAALYQTGEFGAEDTHLVWLVLAGSALGLVGATQGRLINSVFYALHDTRTPLRCAVVRVTIAAGLAWALAFPLRPQLASAILALGIAIPFSELEPAAIGAVGIVLGSAAGAWVEMLMLRRAVEQRIGTVSFDRGFLATVGGGALLAALVSGVISIGFSERGLELMRAIGELGHIAWGCVLAFAFGLTYLGICALRRLPEARRLLARVGVK